MEKDRPAFEDLVAWQKSLAFANEIFELTERLAQGRKHFRLFEQIEASAASVPANIAEGKGRATTKEIIHFFVIARGSLYETLTFLRLFHMRGWISAEEHQRLDALALEVARLLNGLLRSYKS